MQGPERMRAAHAALVCKLGLPEDASAELQFSAHVKHALAQSGPRIKSAIGRCDGVVVAGRRFVELMHALRMYAQDVARVVSGAELGVAEGDPWTFWQYSNVIQWGKMRGLHRTHYHLSHILELQLRGRTGGAGSCGQRPIAFETLAL